MCFIASALKYIIYLDQIFVKNKEKLIEIILDVKDKGALWGFKIYTQCIFKYRDSKHKFKYLGAIISKNGTKKRTFTIRGKHYLRWG